MLGLDLYNGNRLQATLYQQVTGVTFPILMGAASHSNQDPNIQADYGHTVGLEEVMVVDTRGQIQLVMHSSNMNNTVQQVNRMVDDLLAAAQSQSPLISLSRRSVSFGDVLRVGESKTVQLEVRNLGSGDWEVTELQSNLDIQMIPSSFTVPIGQSLVIDFTMTPTQEGRLSGSFKLISNIDPMQIYFSQVTVQPALPPVIVLPQELIDFGQVEVGRSVSQKLQIKNEGEGPLLITEIRSNLAGISVLEQSLTIAAGTEQTITVSVSAQTEGAFLGQLDIVCNDPDRQIIPINLSGMAAVIPADPRTDFDGSGVVDFVDFLAFVKAFGSDDVLFDIDESGRVDFGDFLRFVNAFGKRVDR